MRHNSNNPLYKQQFHIHYTNKEALTKSVTVDTAIRGAVFTLLERSRSINTTDDVVYSRAMILALRYCRQINIPAMLVTPISIEECNNIQHCIVRDY